MIEDICGKSLLALDVFSLSIKALMDHLFKPINDQVNDIQIEDVLWVLTVPAIWNDNAKLFMRKSAEQVSFCINMYSLESCLIVGFFLIKGSKRTNNSNNSTTRCTCI